MATATDPDPYPDQELTDHLRLSQWLSPSFPISAYAYSHGLEAAMEAGQVTDAGSLRAWVETVLLRGAGQTDAAIMLAVRRGHDVDEAGDLARALAGSRERLEETLEQGAALSATLEALGTGDGTPRPYPVVLGLALRSLRLPDAKVAALVLQSFASNLVSAAVRFIPLGQAEGQSVLAALHPVISKAAETATTARLDRLETAVFAADLAAMRHETQEVRIFRT